MRFLLATAFLSQLVLGLETPTPLGGFNNDFEGLYDVKLVCREDQLTPECESLNRDARMVVLNLGTMVAVSIGYPEQSLSRYSFITKQLRDGGRFLAGATGTPLDAVSDGPSEFQAELQTQTWGVELNGWIRDPRFLNDIQVTGRLRQSTASLFHDPSDFPTAPTERAFLGRFLATGGERIWILTIRKRLTSAGDELTAEISDFGSTDGEPGSGIKVRFQSVEIYQAQGVVGIASPLSITNAFLKWTLSLDKGDAEGKNMRGLMISSTGRTSKLFIQRIQ